MNANSYRSAVEQRHMNTQITVAVNVMKLRHLSAVSVRTLVTSRRGLYPSDQHNTRRLASPTCGKAVHDMSPTMTRACGPVGQVTWVNVLVPASQTVHFPRILRRFAVLTYPITRTCWTLLHVTQ